MKKTRKYHPKNLHKLLIFRNFMHLLTAQHSTAQHYSYSAYTFINNSLSGNLLGGLFFYPIPLPPFQRKEEQEMERETNFKQFRHYEEERRSS